MFTGLATVCGVCLLGSVLTAGQAAPAANARAGGTGTFKNVQVLKGLLVDEFLDTMGMFAAATGLNGKWHCHVDESGGSWERYADDPELEADDARDGGHHDRHQQAELRLNRPGSHLRDPATMATAGRT